MDKEKYSYEPMDLEAEEICDGVDELYVDEGEGNQSYPRTQI